MIFRLTSGGRSMHITRSLPFGGLPTPTAKPTCRANRGTVTVGRHISRSEKLSSWKQDTVDGWNPAPVEVGSLSQILHGFIHPNWCRISSINSMSLSTGFLFGCFENDIRHRWNPTSGNPRDDFCDQFTPGLFSLRSIPYPTYIGNIWHVILRVPH